MLFLHCRWEFCKAGNSLCVLLHCYICPVRKNDAVLHFGQPLETHNFPRARREFFKSQSGAVFASHSCPSCLIHRHVAPEQQPGQVENRSLIGNYRFSFWVSFGEWGGGIFLSTAQLRCDFPSAVGNPRLGSAQQSVHNAGRLSADEHICSEPTTHRTDTHSRTQHGRPHNARTNGL